jgi:predicted deacylase
MTKSTEETRQKRNLELLSCFGFSTAVLFESNTGGKKHSGTYSSSAAYRQNVIAITAEIGGAGTVDAFALRQLERGINNYLAHVGLLKHKPDGNICLEEKTQFLEIASENCYVYSRHRGLFEPAVEIGADVTSGQLAGLVHHPDTPMKTSDAVYFELDARVVCKRIPAITERGDCLYELAVPAALP